MTCVLVLSVMTGCAALSSRAKLFSDKEKQELLSAIVKNSPQEVTQILRKGDDANRKAKLQEALSDASFMDRPEVVRSLVEMGADVNEEGKGGMRPLETACLVGRADVVKVLLEKGADVNASDSGGLTPLMVTAKMGRTEVVNRILPKLLSEPAKDGKESESDPFSLPKSPEPYVRIVKLLLDHKADVNARDVAGETVLMKCATSDRSEIVPLLVDRGADVNAKSRAGGYTALHVFSLVGRAADVRRLLDKGAAVDARFKDSYTPLIFASFFGRSDVARELLDKGADVNATNSLGQTPLIAAVTGSELMKQALTKLTAKGEFDEMRWALDKVTPDGRVETAKLLLSRGAAPNRKDNTGTTALMYCAMFGCPDVVPHLLNKGANMNARNSSELTPLMIASLMGPTQTKRVWNRLIGKSESSATKKDTAESAEPPISPQKCFEVAKLLIENGADLNAKDRTGFTALMFSGQMGRPELVKLLVDKGAHVNAREDGGRVALMELAMLGRPELIKPLLDKGAAVNLMDKEGYTALMYAATLGRPAVVKLLLENGADANTRNLKGRTALMGAAIAAIGLYIRREIGGQGIFSGELPDLPVAASEDQYKTAQLLVDHRADVNAKDDSGLSALMFSTLYGRPELVKLLLDNGADVHAKSNRGLTALQMGLRDKTAPLENLELLEARGAKDKP